MFNPSREIFEMPFRQEELERKMEHHQHVKLALAEQTGLRARLLTTIRRLIGRKPRPTRRIALDINQPHLDGLRLD